MDNIKITLTPSELSAIVDRAFDLGKVYATDELDFVMHNIGDAKLDILWDACAMKMRDSLKSVEASSGPCGCQAYRDDIVMLEREVEFYTKKYNELVKQKEASSGPCGCQAYRDLEERADSLGATIQRLKQT